jgi:hypothetical protein
MVAVGTVVDCTCAIGAAVGVTVSEQAGRSIVAVNITDRTSQIFFDMLISSFKFGSNADDEPTDFVL